MYTSWGIGFALLITLACSQKARRSYPTNYIILGAFTVCFSLVVATTASFYGSEVVAIALAITTVAVVGIVLFALQTRIDFTMLRGFIFAFVISLILFGFITLAFQVQILNVLYSSIGAFIFSVILVYDIHALMGGAFGKKYQIDPEEYIFASVNIYLDIIYIFVRILQLVGIAKG